jgi:HTH-type transcriptional regulator/antitoxin HigA
MPTLELSQITRMWPTLSGVVRVPHSEPEYEAAVKLLDHLVDEVGENEEHPLSSLMDVLGVLIERYEEEHVPEL